MTEPIAFNPEAVTAVLLEHVGWQDIQKGSLRIDLLDTLPATPETKGYGFTCRVLHPAQQPAAPPGKPVQVTGRLTALLAVKE